MGGNGRGGKKNGVGCQEEVKLWDRWKARSASPFFESPLHTLSVTTVGEANACQWLSVLAVSEPQVYFCLKNGNNDNDTYLI